MFKEYNALNTEMTHTHQIWTKWRKKMNDILYQSDKSKNQITNVQTTIK